MKKIEDHNIDVFIISDNAIESIGGEQESTKIIIEGVKDEFKLGVIQPGVVTKKLSGVTYFHMTDKTRIKHLIKKPFDFLKYMNKVKNIIHSTNPKIIHTQSQVSFFIIALLKKIRLIPKSIKFIHTERGLYTKYNRFFKSLFLFCMKELDTLITTTEFNMRYWKNALNGRVEPKNYEIIENTAGKLFEYYDPSKKKKDDGRFVVGFAGRYASWKNWPLAVDISKKLKEKLGDKVVVKMAVGCLDQESLNKTNKMFKYMEGVFGDSFEGKINISLEEMDQFYYNLDAFILTSNKNTESFGRTIVEAMSRNVVVLSTDAGGPVEILDNPDNILNNADEFVARLIQFFENSNMIQNEIARNQKIVKSKYSLKNNISKHRKLYKNYIFK